MGNNSQAETETIRKPTGPGMSPSLSHWQSNEYGADNGQVTPKVRPRPADFETYSPIVVASWTPFRQSSRLTVIALPCRLNTIPETQSQFSGVNFRFIRNGNAPGA